MSLVELKPKTSAGEQPQTYASDRAASTLVKERKLSVFGRASCIF